MIRLSTSKYYLEGVSEDFFWKELDKITAGQSLSPQLGYNKPLYCKSESVFVGRKVGNQFSVYPYGPVNRFFRTAILCKGVVSANGRDLAINCNFEYPLWSFCRIVIFVVFALWFFTGLDPIPVIDWSLACAAGAALYCLVVVYNLSKTKGEIVNQLELIEEKAKTESAQVTGDRNFYRHNG